MVNLAQFDLSLKELGAIARPGGMAPYRQSGISLIWTLLPVFDVYVLNLFTPYNHIFWNFSPYYRLRASEIRFTWPYRFPDSGKETESLLTKLIRQAGHRKRSDFAHELLGTWTRTPEFNPIYDEETGLDCIGGRHWSMVVPKADREAVQQHFQEQAVRFGDSALLPYPDDIQLIEALDLDETEHGKLLHMDIRLSRAPDREWLYQQVRQYDTQEALAKLIAALDPRFGIKGHFALWPVLSSFVPFVDMARYAEVLRFHARVALEVCPLPVIEGFVSMVQSGATNGLSEYPPGLGEELLDALEAKLAPYRSVTDFKLPSAPATMIYNT